ncbi:MAG: hypothetical protein R6U13_03735, partial [Desulfatiglandaceae bacterium]
VYFIGRISSSSFSDEFPYPSFLSVLCALATPRDANILLILSILSEILNPAPQAPPTLTPAVRARSKHRFDTPKADADSLHRWLSITITTTTTASLHSTDNEL